MPIDFTKPVPLYKQVVDHIKHQIEDGYLKPGDRIGSHHDLARDYNVSLITVRKALSELINEKIVYSRMGKGTYVAERRICADFAEHINLGLVLRDLNSPFFSRIVEEIERHASRLGANLLVSTSSNSIEMENRQIKRYMDIGISGLILTSITSRSHVSPLVRKLHTDNFPYVIVAFTEDEDINYVGVDHEYGAYLATEHLIKTGHERIGYINSENGYHLGEVRKAGYIRALNTHGILHDEEYHFRLRGRGNWLDYESGYEIGIQVSGMSARPDAIFAYNDLAALGFQRAVLDRGIKVPDEIAIIGFDNIKRGVVCPVPLTTIDQCPEEIAAKAINIVMNKINRIDTSNRIILKPKLIVRDSCGSKAWKMDRTKLSLIAD